MPDVILFDSSAVVPTWMFTAISSRVQACSCLLPLAHHLDNHSLSATSSTSSTLYIRQYKSYLLHGFYDFGRILERNISAQEHFGYSFFNRFVTMLVIDVDAYRYNAFWVIPYNFILYLILCPLPQS